MVNHIEVAEMNIRLEQFDDVDAIVFSSDMLHIDSEREAFKQYLGRWQRALSDYELTWQPALPIVRNSDETE